MVVGSRRLGSGVASPCVGHGARVETRARHGPTSTDSIVARRELADAVKRVSEAPELAERIAARARLAFEKADGA